MWDKIAGFLGGGVSQALDSIKKLAVDTWHIDAAKQAELDQAMQALTQDYALKVAQAEATVLAMENSDRANARQREVDSKDHTTKIMAFILVAGFFAIVWFMLLYDVPPQSQRILDMMLGSLMASFTGVVAYYFGSSKGSATKQELIDRMTK